jgi:hypothetical protein
VKARFASCPIAAAVINPGKATIFQQSNDGFCNEWIVGPVSFTQVIN